MGGDYVPRREARKLLFWYGMHEIMRTYGSFLACIWLAENTIQRMRDEGSNKWKELKGTSLLTVLTQEMDYPSETDNLTDNSFRRRMIRF